MKFHQRDLDDVCFCFLSQISKHHRTQRPSVVRRSWRCHRRRCGRQGRRPCEGRSPLIGCQRNRPCSRRNDACPGNGDKITKISRKVECQPK